MNSHSPRWIAFPILVGLLASAAPAAEKLRLWKDVSGKFSLRAELVDFDNSTVQLRRQDGKVISVPMAKLSSYDRLHLQKLAPKNTPPEDATTTASPQAQQPPPARRPEAADIKPLERPGEVGTVAGPEQTPEKPSTKIPRTSRYIRTRDGEWRVYVYDQPMRKWKIKGKEIEGTIKSMTNTKIVVVTADEEVLTIAKSELSLNDRVHVGLLSGALLRQKEDWTKRVYQFRPENDRALPIRRQPKPERRQPMPERRQPQDDVQSQTP